MAKTETAKYYNKYYQHNRPPPPTPSCTVHDEMKGLWWSSTSFTAINMAKTMNVKASIYVSLRRDYIIMHVCNQPIPLRICWVTMEYNNIITRTYQRHFRFVRAASVCIWPRPRHLRPTAGWSPELFSPEPCSQAYLHRRPVKEKEIIAS